MKAKDSEGGMVDPRVAPTHWRPVALILRATPREEAVRINLGKRLIITKPPSDFLARVDERRRRGVSAALAVLERPPDVQRKQEPRREGRGSCEAVLRATSNPSTSVPPHCRSWHAFVTWATGCGYVGPDHLTELVLRELEEEANMSRRQKYHWKFKVLVPGDRNRLWARFETHDDAVEMVAKLKRRGFEAWVVGPDTATAPVQPVQLELKFD